MKFILATKNLKKLKELERILVPLGHEVVCERDLENPLPEVVEDADSFEGNALLKARSAMKITGLAAVADDSGLCVDYLDGAPGVYSARFTGNHEDSDEQRYLYLLEKLEGVTDRSAKFVSAITCTFPNGDVLRARGECHGKIALAPSGSGGFGYDPVFIPDGFDCSMAELGTEKKNEIAHRGKAIRAFLEELRNYYADK